MVDLQSISRAFLEQIDLEINLKLLFARSTQARLDYALLLYAFIRDNEADPVKFHETSAEDAVRTATRELDHLTDKIVSPLSIPISTVQAQDTAEWPRSFSRANRSVKAKKGDNQDSPLYVQTRFNDPPIVARLSCRDCGRFNFPSIQGLLNHCRLSHNREFSGHDALVESCGEILPAAEGEALIRNGVDIKAVNLPSLRSLFEKAVSGTSILATKEAKLFSAPEEGTFLSKTLGWHRDTPGLAAFLGSSSRQRTIRSFDDGNPIDILNEDLPTKALGRWKPLGRHRNPGINLGTQLEEKSTSLVTDQTADGRCFATYETGLDERSRFHIRRRVVVSDHSCITSHSDSSHIWTISVTSPAYSKHISTFLEAMEVTCLTHPPVFKDPIIVSTPPFVCEGNSSRPFLANVRLIWPGVETPPIDLEHWVDLYPFKTSRPVLGEEQIVDVDLDKNTVELPLRVCDNYSATLLRKSDPIQRESERCEPQHSGTLLGEKDLSFHLRSLLPNFPLTAQDARKRRHPPRLPYVLLPGPVDFNALPAGRRKAIEWARALAIRDAYEKLALEAAKSKTLSTGIVYRWIQEETQYEWPRTHTDGPSGLVSAGCQLLFCSSCGINLAFHRKTQPSESTVNGIVCGNSIARLPLVDVNWWIKRHRQVGYWGFRIQVPGSYNDLIGACEPSLLSMAAVIMRKSGVDLKAGTWDSIAAAGLLGLLIEVYLRKLTRISVIVLQELARVSGVQTNGPQCLTRSHIFRALLQGAFKGGLPEAIFTGCAEIGSPCSTTFI